MKIQSTPNHPVPYINQNSRGNAVQQDPAPVQDGKIDRQQTDGKPKVVGRQKVTLPDELQPLMRLTRQEQAYFEQLFPKAKREIRAYVEQQQKVFQEKGQIIDLKG